MDLGKNLHLRKCPAGIVCPPNIYSGCTQYTGVGGFGCLNYLSFEENDKQSVDFVIDTLALDYCRYKSGNKVILDFLSQKELDPGPAIILLGSYVARFNDENMISTADLSCIGQTSSIYAGPLRDKNLKYSLNAGVQGGNYTFDMSEFEQNLPADYQVLFYDTVIHHKSEALGGEPVQVSSLRGSTGNYVIPNFNFPAVADHTVTVSTPGGLLRFKRTVGITTAGEALSGSVGFELMSSVSAKQNTVSQKDVNSLLAREVCGVKNTMNSFKEVAITGCNEMQHASKKIDAIVATHDGALCNFFKRFSNLGAEKIKMKRCITDCEKTHDEVTLAFFIDYVCDLLCELQADKIKQDNAIAELQRVVQICCKGGAGNLGGGGTENSLLGGSNSSNGGGSSSNGGGSSSGGGSNSGGGGSNGGTDNGGGSDNGGTDDGGSDTGGGVDPPSDPKGYTCVPTGAGQYGCQFTGQGNLTRGQCEAFCNKFICGTTNNQKACVKALVPGGPYFDTQLACEQGGCLNVDPCKGLYHNSKVTVDCAGSTVTVEINPLDTFKQFSGNFFIKIDNAANQNYRKTLETHFDGNSDPLPPVLALKVPPQDGDLKGAVITVWVELDAGCTSNVLTVNSTC